MDPQGAARLVDSPNGLCSVPELLQAQSKILQDILGEMRKASGTLKTATRMPEPVESGEDAKVGDEELVKKLELLKSIGFVENWNDG